LTSLPIIETGHTVLQMPHFTHFDVSIVILFIKIHRLFYTHADFRLFNE
jgi:hypothetical protein